MSDFGLDRINLLLPVISLTPYEMTRADPHERHAIAMIGIHVRLDLENETRERPFDGIDLDPFAVTRNRPRSQLQKALEEGIDAEIGERTAEEHRGLAASRDERGIEFGARPVEQFEPVADLVGKGTHLPRYGLRIGLSVYDGLLDPMRPMVAA